MPILSQYAQKKKIEYFIDRIPKKNKILEIGCANGWVGEYLKKNGWVNYIGLDIFPPADIVGDIRNWNKLGIKEQSFDIIIAFEVVEHVDCFKECYDILKPGGMLMITSPVPHMDWFMKILEFIGLNQKRTSSHTNLIYFKDILYFQEKNIKIITFLSQWGILIK